MNACFQKLYNTVNHCKMYTISYFNVLVFFAYRRYEPCHVGYSQVPFRVICVYTHYAAFPFSAVQFVTRKKIL